MRLGLATLVCFLSSVWLTECAPPTCYSRALGLSKEVMALLDKIHTYHLTKTCAEVLPTIFIDVHNSCITTKLRDLLYVVLNHPSQFCRERPRMVLLKRKVQNLYTIITRICYRVRTSQKSALFFDRGIPVFMPERLDRMTVFVFYYLFFCLFVFFLAGPGVFHR
uniref:Cytokine like 1 n=1 Tax=Lates calcarifer TaxID=8187 RepID=A0A4W6BXP2_LATCA